MEATRTFLPKREIGRLLSTREGMIVVAGLVALLAGAMLLFFLSRYRESVKGSGQPATVLVANSPIEKGSSGDVIAAKGMFQTTSTKEGQLEQGAIADPSSLRGQVAVNNIYSGQQLTAADFSKSTDALTNKLADFERAISVPLDAAHGMIGNVHTGDRIDVLAGFNSQSNVSGRGRPVLKVVMQDVLVLEAPPKAKGGPGAGSGTENIVLRVRDNRAAQLAFAADNGKVWIVLRPQAGAQQTRPSSVTLENLLVGTKPITVQGSKGGQ